MKKILLIFSVALIGCTGTTRYNNDNIFFNPLVIKSNIEVLASDEFEGRDAASRGEKLAALFIASELQKYGVKKFGDDHSYYQSFDLQFAHFDTATQIDLLDNKSALLASFNYYTDFVGYAANRVDIDTTAEVVFAGYGIIANEYNHNDYLNIDVAGKFALVLSGEPLSEDSSYFAGNQTTRYSFSRSKRESAEQNGALGVIIISSGRFPWQDVASYLSRPRIYLPVENEDMETEINKDIFSIALNENVASAFFRNAILNFDSLMTMHDTGRPLPGLNLDINLAVKSRTVEPQLKKTQNVVGMIEGNDPVLKNEYVSIGAHYDHVGVRSGDVYNGADDNASGTVGLLETARVFAQTKNTKRSLLFIFYAAEERGLLGSKYFTANFDKMDDIVVNINLDMIGRESADTLFSVGSNRMSTELHNIIEYVNEKNNLFVFDYKFNDPEDPQRIYYRSDHINFVRKGIPSVFFFDNHEEDYHKPTDDADKINYKKIARVSRLVYGVAERVANMNYRLRPDVKE